MSADKQFLVEYNHQGLCWSLSVWADDWADAERKVRSIANGRVLGEVAMTVPVPGGSLLASAWRLLTGR